MATSQFSEIPASTHGVACVRMCKCFCICKSVYVLSPMCWCIRIWVLSGSEYSFTSEPSAILGLLLMAAETPLSEWPVVKFSEITNRRLNLFIFSKEEPRKRRVEFEQRRKYHWKPAEATAGRTTFPPAGSHTVWWARGACAGFSNEVYFSFLSCFLIFEWN